MRPDSPKDAPSLRFTPRAWAKLVFLRDLGPTEVGGFGISAAGDPLLVEEVQLVRQVCTAVTVAFDDAAVADHFDEQVDQGITPEHCGRIWIHTHPGSSPEPSFTDEATFERSFSAPDWALMFILARGGQSYARIRFRAGPGGQLQLPVRVDFHQPFAASEHDAWEAEYDRCVQQAEYDQLSLELKETIVAARDDLFDPFHHLVGAPWW